MTITKALFDPNGRMRRRDYWLYSIVYSIAVAVIYFIGFMALSQGGDFRAFAEEMSGVYSLQFTPFNLFFWGLSLAAYYPSVCLMSKRFHDRNRSGWLAGVYIVLNLVLSAVQATTVGTSPILSGAAGVISFGLLIWVFVDLGCLDGTHGRNKYGPSPKGIGDEAQVF